MATISSKGDAARQFLASLPEFSGGDKSVGQLSDAYANRLASTAQRQLAAGVTPSRQAARGHVLTPEHGQTGAAPKLPEKPVAYKQLAQRIKDTSLRPEGPSRPSQRVRAALEGEARPRFHTRERSEGHIPYADTGEIYTRNSEADARAIVRYAAEVGPTHGERLVMQAYDCSKRRWFPVFKNAGHGQGISASALLEQAREHGGSFESYVMDTINDAAYHGRGRIGHICQYEITILPRETAPVKRLREQLKQQRKR